MEIQKKIKEGLFSLGWSYILDFETSVNPFSERKIEIQTWKQAADSFVKETPGILAEMNTLVSNYGLKPLDALHLSCANALRCDYFLTVDKGILKKAVSIKTILIMNPIDFVIEWETKQ